jgi:plasmid stability protein
MSDKTKRSTIYLDENLHKALRLKAAAVDASMSDIVNDALRAAFDEDASDLMDIRKRSKERVTSFDSFVTKLKASGKL